jgi:hypothetical protein
MEKSNHDSATVGGPPKILCLGMPRTGTESMSQALGMLGYDPVHHAIAMITNGWDQTWVKKAAEAHYPGVHPYRGQRAGEAESRPHAWGRAEWDQVFGSFAVVTDVSWKFAPSLIAAYPDALVIMTERNVDTWERSVSETIIPRLWPESLLQRIVQNLYGYLDEESWQLAEGTRATYLGKFGAHSPEDLKTKLKTTYVTHAEEIRAAIPADKLLSYKIGKLRSDCLVGMAISFKTVLLL